MNDEASKPGAVRRRGPSPAKTAVTRRAITAAARSLFIEKGLAATRIQDVAERALVAKGTLYLYFPDKDALLQAVLSEAIGTPLAALRRHAKPEGEDTLRYLKRVVIPLLARAERSGTANLIRLVVSEGARYPQLASIYRGMVLEPMSEFFRTIAENATSQDEVAGDGLVRFPLLLIAPALMATVWNGLSPADQQISPAAAFEALVDLVFKTKPGAGPPKSAVEDSR